MGNERTRVAGGDRGSKYLYIASSPYSGSTLLATVLAGYPRVTAVGGASSARRSMHMDEFVCSCGSLMRDCDYWERVRAGMHARGFTDFDLADFGLSFEDGGHFVRARHGSLRYAALERLRDAALFTWPAGRRRLAELGRRHAAFAETVLGLSGGTLLVDTSKERMRARRLLRLRDYLDVRFVHLVRDVRGVVSSAIRRGRMDGSARRAALNWQRTNAAIHRALADAPRHTTLTVRYEDLCREPDAVTRRILALCGLEPTAMTGGQQHVLGNRMRLSGPPELRLDERWRSALSAAQQAEALVSGGRFQARLYPEPEGAHGS